MLFSNIDETVQLILDKYNTQNKTKEALFYEANNLKELAYFGIKKKNFGQINKYKIQRIYDVYNLLGFVKNKIDIDKFVFHNNTINLTLKEEEYLKSKKIIKMCIDPNWMSFEKIEENRHIGFNSDYIDLISKKIDKDISLVKTSTWAESIEKAKNRECDIFSMVAKTEQREKYMDFTNSFISGPVVIATKPTNRFIYEIKQVKDKNIGIVKGHWLVEVYRKKYPYINIIEVDSIQDGLEKVKSGKIFGYVDNSIVINYEIERNFPDVINISGVFNDKVDFYIATRNDEKQLNSIIKKAQKELDREKLKELEIKWFDTDTKNKLLNQMSLTKQERRYLKGKKTLSVCVKKDWLPFESIEDDRFVGISADFFNSYF